MPSCPDCPTDCRSDYRADDRLRHARPDIATLAGSGDPRPRRRPRSGRGPAAELGEGRRVGAGPPADDAPRPAPRSAPPAGPARASARPPASDPLVDEAGEERAAERVPCPDRVDHVDRRRRHRAVASPASTRDRPAAVGDEHHRRALRPDPRHGLLDDLARAQEREVLGAGLDDVRAGEDPGRCERARRRGRA